MLYGIIAKARGYNINRYLKEFLKSQYFTKKELEEIQISKLVHLISYAYTYVPYYRKIMDERGLTPQDICDKRDLSKLPILTKAIVKENYKELISTGKRNFVVSNTGGSTGEPLSFLLDKESLATIGAAQLRGMGWAGYRYGDKYIALAGSSLGISNKKESLKDKFFTKLNNYIPLAAVHMDNSIIAKYCAQININKPSFIRGYPSAIFLLSHYILEHNLPIWKPKAIFTTAEILHQKFRNEIEKAFECKIFDGYGCHDGGAHAFECNNHAGLHFADERAVFEIIPDSPDYPNEGEILLTDLHNYAMPFIRYAPGDKIKLSANKCGCGRELSLIEHVTGRTSDLLRFKNYNVLSMPAITLIFREFSFLQYQLHQLSESDLLINLVYTKHSSNDEVLKLITILQKHLGQDVRIECKKVDHIPLTKAGKAKICISDLPENMVC